METLKIVDLASAVSSVLLVAVLPGLFAQKHSLADFLGRKMTIANGLLFLFLLCLWYVVLYSCNLYDPKRRLTIGKEVLNVTKAVLVSASIVLLTSQILLGAEFAAPPSLVVFWMNTTMITVLGRLLVRCGVRHFWPSSSVPYNVIIVGTHERAINFADEVTARPELGYRIVGFVDGADEIPHKKNHYDIVADFAHFPEYLRKHPVDEVIICLPVKSLYQQAVQVAAVCEEHGIVVSFISDIFRPRQARAIPQLIQGHPMVTFYTGQMVGAGMVIKRFIDLALSLLLILVLSPVMLLAAILIKATSPGPVLFIQKRLGRNKHEFMMYKFRTMHIDAEEKIDGLYHLNEMSGPVFKIKRDPRVTAIGRFLRAASIDELPQLFNILKGDMSLVGPRPLAIRDCAGFETDWHRRRFSVRPGITCLWQVRGRNEVPFERWMEFDMEYIDNWSLWLDLKILMKTIPVVLRGYGAS